MDGVRQQVVKLEKRRLLLPRSVSFHNAQPALAQYRQVNDGAGVHSSGGHHSSEERVEVPEEQFPLWQEYGNEERQEVPALEETGGGLVGMSRYLAQYLSVELVLEVRLCKAL